MIGSDTNCANLLFTLDKTVLTKPASKKLKTAKKCIVSLKDENQSKKRLGLNVLLSDSVNSMSKETYYV